MGTAGLTESRLQTMHTVLTKHTELGDTPGLVALISHNDHVHVETLGRMFTSDEAPMQRDTIFRIASLTKLVTAVAAMVLVEDCRMRLDDAVDAWIPELASRRVLRTLASQIDDTVPATRAITVRDLLTSQMGMGSIMAMPGTYPIQQYIREYRIGGDGPMLPAQSPTMSEWVSRLGSLPLVAQPGAQWMYHTSIDVLGALITRVSKQSLDDFMREHIFEPLGMTDTGFHVPADKLHRLPGFYFFDRATSALGDFDPVTNSAFSQSPAFESGGGGLVSTVDDFYAFARMLLNNGKSGDHQILSRASVELMTSDQVPASHRTGAEIFFGDGLSWGFGMSVRTARDEIYHTQGRFGWDGGFGTSAYIDPANNMLGILFTQRMMDSPTLPAVYSDFWTLAYGAME